MPLSPLDAPKRRLEPLRELLHGDVPNAVVPFVGSGLSKGLWSWKKLMEELIAFAPELTQAELRQGLDQGKYLDVAEHLDGMPEVGPARIQETLRRAFETTAPPPEGYAALVQLPTQHYITTNFDPWLKNSVSSRLGHVPNVLLPEDVGVLGHLDRTQPWVWYLHGDVHKPETCVLTARAYRRLLHSTPAWRKAFEGVVQARHLLFLGTSLNEPHLSVLFDAFEEAFSTRGGPRRHWWIGRSPGALEEGRLRRLGIEVVVYDDHELLPVLLEWLATKPGSGPVEVARAEAPSQAPTRPEFDPNRPWFFVPFKPKGSGMVGRDDALKRVRSRLAEGRPTAIGQAAAFTGIGGIGKTQLAVEYCWERRPDYPGGVYWFTQDQDIDGQILRLSDEAKWVHPAVEPAMKLQMARHRLKTLDGALFVYDNVERTVVPGDLYPPAGPGNHVLVTSRFEQPVFERVEVDLLDEAQGVAMLASEAGREPADDAERAAAARIVWLLDGLPLAIELAGAYLRRFPRRAFQDYLDLLERRGPQDSERAVPQFAERSATGHGASLADALRISGPLLDAFPDLDRALDVLAWSASASMGWSLLVALVAPGDADQLRDGLDLAELLRILRREDGDRPEARYRMHRLVQDVRRRERRVEDQPALATDVLGRMTGWFEGRRQEFADLAAYEAEIDHLEAWCAVADAQQNTGLGVRLRWLRAYPHWHRGAYAPSMVEVQGALRRYEAAGLDDPLLEAHLRSDLATLCNHSGKAKDALQAGSRALELRRKILGDRHPDTAMSFQNVGGAYHYLGDHHKALEYENRALELRRELLGDLHPDTATSYNNLGGTYRALGDHRKALKYVTRALELHRELTGDRHPTIASLYNNLGGACRDLGDHRKALEYVTRSLKLRQELLGDRHPDTATTYASLGATYYSLGNYYQALKYVTRALNVQGELLGERHPETVNSAIGLMITLGKLGRRQEQHELAKRLVHQLPPSTPRYKELIAAYNDSCPPGFRALGPDGPGQGANKKDSRKKGR